MWERIKSIALAVLGALTWLLGGWLYLEKEKLAATNEQLAQEKAKEGVATALQKESQDAVQTQNADKTFEQLAADYEKANPPPALVDPSRASNK